MIVSALGLLGVTATADETIEGERLDRSLYGRSYVESMEAAVDRDRLAPPPEESDQHRDRSGVWMVPSRGATTFPHSGANNAVNKWGDTRMGIGFGSPVDVHGAYFAGQADEGVWTPGIQVIGYRYGDVVGQTDWFFDIGAEPRWLAMNLRLVDRIEIVSLPAFGGGGWYGMDDLTYSRPTGEKIVVDFDGLPYRCRLTGSSYADLTWEHGLGPRFDDGTTASEDAVPSPMVPPEARVDESGALTGFRPVDRRASNSQATLPTLEYSFQGVIRGDAGSLSFPPDTAGAIGPNQFVETVNRNFAVYDKTTGAELINVLLGSFLPGSNGDPRVLFDHHSGRWIVIVTDFSANTRIYLAVSLTDDPTGDWFKTSFVTGQGSDSGCWPDYPTLGVDANGIYTGAYMVGCGMSIFAIEKAPLIDPAPSLGTITAFRGLSWGGALQPAHTYGASAPQYVVSVAGSTSLRIRRINSQSPPWTMTDLGTVGVPYFSDPPNAPALGSGTLLNTVDDRLMMAVYRDGSIWTCHTISVSGRTGCRWYEIDPVSMSLVQSGTVADDSLYYFFPSIMVNQIGHVAMAFTGSNSSQYAACYYTGRLATETMGEMATPVMFKLGTGPQNNIDGFGRNRWGDYSYTTLDPVDELTFWTLQEYGHANNIWGTYVAVLNAAETDCNENEIPDACDVNCGSPGGYCDVVGCGQGDDCNSNGVLDECEGNLLPGITEQPASLTVCEGESASFSAGADGWEPLSYQWRLNGVDIPDVTSSVYAIDPVTPADAGDYDVVVTNVCGTVTSDLATLIVVVDADCDDLNPCTDDSCSAGSCGYVNNMASCDDLDACTVDDVCAAGACKGTYRARPYGDIQPVPDPPATHPCDADEHARKGDGFRTMLDVMCAFNAMNDGAPYLNCPCADVNPCPRPDWPHGGDNFLTMLDVMAIFNTMNDPPSAPCSDPCP